VVLLVFVGILAAMAGGKLSAIRNQQTVVRAASTVQTQMEKAFAIAGRNRAPIRISWSSSSGKLSVTKRDGSVSYGVIDFTTLGLKASDVSVDNNPVDVFPNGWASSTLCVAISTSRASVTYSRRICMTKAGLVKVT
jgi:hypothetical protein